MECGEQSVTMAGMKEMQLLSVSSWGLDNQVSKLHVHSDTTNKLKKSHADINLSSMNWVKLTACITL